MHVSRRQFFKVCSIGLGGSSWATLVPMEKAVGRRALHDMTRIIPEREKGVAFHRGQTITAGDVGDTSKA